MASRISVFTAAMRGPHIGMPGVATRSLREVRLRFHAPPIYEVDGELMQANSADVTVRCEPGVLTVVCGPA